jgi:hypothetical protein
MSFKDQLNKGLDAIKEGAENAKDAISEAGHRAAAAAEQSKRDVAGDEMTPGEKVSSVVRQGSETIKADVDATKRDVRSSN